MTATGWFVLSAMAFVIFLQSRVIGRVKRRLDEAREMNEDLNDTIDALRNK